MNGLRLSKIGKQREQLLGILLHIEIGCPEKVVVVVIELQRAVSRVTLLATRER